MGSDVVIHPLGHDDLPALDAFVQVERAGLNRDEGGAWQLATQLMTDTAVTLVASDDTRIVGIAALTGGTSERDEHIAQLRIHLRAEYRGNGLGSRLLQAALDWADQHGIQRTVATPYYRPGSVNGVGRFFEKHGFRFEGRMRQGTRLLDGSLNDVLLYARTS
jgi:RimJ/RimL family protein N-acetyltransferase